MEQYLVDKSHTRERLEEMLQDGDLTTQGRSRIMERISDIDKLLGNTASDSGSGDPLVDLWEAQIEAGLDPDMEMTMEDLRNGR
jgi:hypothetical protein